MYYVYVLQSEKDGNMYIGQTKNLEARLKAHNYGKVRSTKPRRPLKLVYWEEAESREESLDLELKWKTSTGRRKIRQKIQLNDKK